MRTPPASKQRCCVPAAKWVLTQLRIKRQYAPQLVHQCEIIVPRSAAVQVAKQICVIITPTTDE